MTPRVGDVVHVRGTVTSIDTGGGIQIEFKDEISSSVAFAREDQIIHIEPAPLKVGDPAWGRGNMETTDWQPIETAPKDKPILIYIPEDEWYIKHHIYAAMWGDMDNAWMSTSCADRYYGTRLATHWMPLPEPPQ